MTYKRPDRTTTSASGYAGGWSVHKSLYGMGWNWSAYGPRGGTQGTARTEAEAKESAQRAAADLKGPSRPRFM